MERSLLEVEAAATAEESLYSGWPRELDPVTVLSDGLGQDSMAMKLLVLFDRRFSEYRRNLVCVTADTGAEQPETYEYLETVIRPLLARQSPPVPLVVLPSILKERDGTTHVGLESYLKAKRIVPSIDPRRRWCTDRAKISLIHQWVKHQFGADRRINMLVGFGAEEFDRRARQFASQNGANVKVCLPLFDAGLCRHEAVALIRRHGFDVPVKSGCWFCPFQKKASWKRLHRRHPGLFWKAVRLEESGRGFGRGIGLSYKPLRELVRTQDRAQKPKLCKCGRPKNEAVLYFGGGCAAAG